MQHYISHILFDYHVIFWILFLFVLQIIVITSNPTVTDQVLFLFFVVCTLHIGPKKYVGQLSEFYLAIISALTFF